MNIEIVAAAWEADLRRGLHALHRLLEQKAALRRARIIQSRYTRVDVLIATTLGVIRPKASLPLAVVAWAAAMVRVRIAVDREQPPIFCRVHPTS